MKDLKPISREELKAAFELIDAAEKAMGDLPFRAAVPAVQNLAELRNILGEALPGGFYTYCESCELPIGCDEEHSTGEDDGTTLCGDCLQHYQADAA